MTATDPTTDPTRTAHDQLLRASGAPPWHEPGHRPNVPIHGVEHQPLTTHRDPHRDPTLEPSGDRPYRPRGRAAASPKARTSSTAQLHRDALELRGLLKLKAHDLVTGQPGPGQFNVDLKLSNLSADELELLRRTVESPERR